jgi:glycosyltransferase involved in cell wall biosynthesis
MNAETNWTRTIVVPCYNEAERLDTERFRQFTDGGLTRFLFVDDGSSDATASILSELAGSEPERIGLLTQERNRGKGEAVRLGLLEALKESPEAVGYWDADLATPLTAIPLLCSVLEERAEVQMVLGSRVKLMGREIERHAHRHYIGRVFATAASLILRLPVYDTQCGAKVLRTTDRLRQILEEPFRANWTFDVELLARFMWSDPEESLPDPQRTIYEFPLPVWRDVGGSKLHVSDYPRVPTDLLTIYLTYARPARRQGRSRR